MVSRRVFGRLADETAVDLYTVLGDGIEVLLTDFGARVVGIRVPDRAGTMGDVVMGYTSLEEYVADRNTYTGAVVGRYGNRLARGRFRLDGKSYRVPRNDRENALHGGKEGFDRKVWRGEVAEDGVAFTLVSPAGDQGFPGTLTLRVRYSLGPGELRLAYEATTDAATVINVTNHAYFNLAGAGRGTVLDHVLEMPADRFTPVDQSLIPTGELRQVDGTPFDFRQATRIGERIDAEDQQIKVAGGYDQNWVLGVAGEMKLAAVLREPASGRVLTVRTTEPGVQFYSGNFLVGDQFPKRSGLCLETQHFPDSPNWSEFPSTVLRPGEVMRLETVFGFGVDRGV